MLNAPQQPYPSAIALTIGDPTGIGPEIAVKFLKQHVAGLLAASSNARPLVIYGDIDHLAQTAASLQLDLPQGVNYRYVDVQTHGLGIMPKLPGEIAYESLIAATTDIHQGHAQVLVTGPISKAHLEAVGIPFSGHTEILQHQARKLYQRPCQSDMLFVFRQFRMLLLTRHVALRKVSEELTIKGVTRSLSNLAEFFQDYCGIQRPRFCMLGVNPHAGEIDGDEEERVLKPALRLITQKYGFGIEPPMPADAAFRHFDLNHLHYDAFVAAYHDQGLIPFKMVAGLSAVNVTIGLPFLRTSVSHGTAPDIAGQGIADPASLIEAYHNAVELMSPLQNIEPAGLPVQV